MHRVTVSIQDAVSGAAREARVSFRHADNGDYYPPFGHARKIAGRRYGGDLSLFDGTKWAYVPARFEIDLPAGEIEVQAVRGFEYDVYRARFDPSQLDARHLTIPLKRWINMEARGWHPGDTHHHFPGPSATMLEMKGEGLGVANLLALKSGAGHGERSGDGELWNTEHFEGRLSRLSGPRHLLYVNEEFRNHFLGHLIFLNLRKLVPPISTGELPENGWGGFDLPTHADAAESARRQGGLVLWAHFPYPNGECPVDTALGKIDGFDLLTTGSPFELHPTLRRIYKMYGPKIYDMAPIDIYYAYLNCGFRVTATAGSDKMGPRVPLGSARVYAQTGSSFAYPNWIDAIRCGHTFISTGPLVEINVDGRGPGDEIAFDASETADGPVELRVEAVCRSRTAYDKLELIRNGKVIAEAAPQGEHFEAKITAKVEMERTGWLAARCHGREMLPYGGPPGHWFRMPVFAHTSPVWVTLEGRRIDPGNAPELFLDQIDDLGNYITHRGNYPDEASKQRGFEQIEKARRVYRALAAGRAQAQ